MKIQAVLSGALLLCVITATSSQQIDSPIPMIPGVDPLTLDNLICFGTATQNQEFFDACTDVDFDAVGNSTVSLFS